MEITVINEGTDSIEVAFPQVFGVADKFVLSIVPTDGTAETFEPIVVSFNVALFNGFIRRVFCC